MQPAANFVMMSTTSLNMCQLHFRHHRTQQLDRVRAACLTHDLVPNQTRDDVCCACIPGAANPCVAAHDPRNSPLACLPEIYFFFLANVEGSQLTLLSTSQTPHCGTNSWGQPRVAMVTSTSQLGGMSPSAPWAHLRSNKETATALAAAARQDGSPPHSPRLFCPSSEQSRFHS